MAGYMFYSLYDFCLHMFLWCSTSSADMGDCQSVVWWGRRKHEVLLHRERASSWVLCTETRKHKMTFWGKTRLDHLYGQHSMTGYNF